MRSLANELTRRMPNSSERVDMATNIVIVDDYRQKLLNSGYCFISIRKIVIAGVKGYARKVFNSKKQGGQKLPRRAVSQDS